MAFNEQYLIYERLPLIDFVAGKKRIRLLFLRTAKDSTETHYSMTGVKNRIKILEDQGIGKKYTFKTERI